jgi:hypothetical protein
MNLANPRLASAGSYMIRNRNSTTQALTATRADDPTCRGMSVDADYTTCMRPEGENIPLFREVLAATIARIRSGRNAGWMSPGPVAPISSHNQPDELATDASGDFAPRGEAPNRTAVRWDDFMRNRGSLIISYQTGRSWPRLILGVDSTPRSTARNPQNARLCTIIQYIASR